MTDLDPYTLPPPNVRSMLVPDPGYVLIEADLARADAQVVAWDADCRELKAIFQRGDDIHTDNARLLYGRDVPTGALHINGMSFRDNAKRAVHLTNYFGQANTLSTACSLPKARAEWFIRHWTVDQHPAIGEWHNRVRWSLSRRKLPVIRNAFGFQRMYTDRPDRLLNQALAWIAQSTVATVINHCLLNINDNLCQPGGNWGCQLLGIVPARPDPLLQVHDSVLLQAPASTVPDVFEAILAQMQVEVPYPDPLIIPSELKWSEESWGSMRKIKDV